MLGRKWEGPSPLRRIAFQLGFEHGRWSTAHAGKLVLVTASLVIGYVSLIGFPLRYGKSGLLPALLIGGSLLAASGWWIFHLARRNKTGMGAEEYRQNVDTKWRFIVPAVVVSVLAGGFLLRSVDDREFVAPEETSGRTQAPSSSPSSSTRESSTKPSTESQTATSDSERPSSSAASEVNGNSRRGTAGGSQDTGVGSGGADQLPQQQPGGAYVPQNPYPAPGGVNPPSGGGGAEPVYPQPGGGTGNGGGGDYGGGAGTTGGGNTTGGGTGTDTTGGTGTGGGTGATTGEGGVPDQPEGAGGVEAN